MRFLLTRRKGGIFTRAPSGPIITALSAGLPKGTQVYNPTINVVRISDPSRFVQELRDLRTEMLVCHFRAKLYIGNGDWYSQIMRCESYDGGLTWENYQKAWDVDRTNPGHLRGHEDPRATWVEGVGWRINYAVFDGKGVELHGAGGESLYALEHYGPLLPRLDLSSWLYYIDWEVPEEVKHNPLAPNEDSPWNKSGVTFPLLINGEVWMLFGEGGIGIASSKPSEPTNWQVWGLLRSRPGTKYFDNMSVEVGSTPILTPYGWLVFYHGIDKQRRYRTGVLLLDLNDPRRVIWRSKKPIFWPISSDRGTIDVIPGMTEAQATGDQERVDAVMAEAEAQNAMPRVAFASTNWFAVVGGTLMICFGLGSGDCHICMASARWDDVLSFLPRRIRWSHKALSILAWWTRSTSVSSA